MKTRFATFWNFDGPIPAALAAVVCGGAWLIKYALIDANGGPLADEGFWIPFTYVLGLLTLFAAGGLGAWALAGSRPAWLRSIAAATGVAVGFTLHQILDVVGGAFDTAEAWQRDEISIWLTAVVMLASGAAGMLFAGTSKNPVEGPTPAPQPEPPVSQP